MMQNKRRDIVIKVRDVISLANNTVINNVTLAPRSAARPTAQLHLAQLCNKSRFEVLAQT